MISNLRQFLLRLAWVDANDPQRSLEPRQMLVESKNLAAKRTQLFGDCSSLDKAGIGQRDCGLRLRQPAATEVSERFSHRVQSVRRSGLDLANLSSWMVMSWQARTYISPSMLP